MATQNKDYISHSPLQLDVFMWLSFNQWACYFAASRNLPQETAYMHPFPFSNPFVFPAAWDVKSEDKSG